MKTTLNLDDDLMRTLKQRAAETGRTMTEIIDVLRSYESYQKVIQQIDETEAKAINDVGQVV